MPAKILFADDNSVTRKTIRSFLGWHSFQICGEARCGKEAVAKVRELKPDIVLLDINMPDMNGIKTAYEILRASRENRLFERPRKSAASIELLPTLCRLAGIDQQAERMTETRK